MTHGESPCVKRGRPLSSTAVHVPGSDPWVLGNKLLFPHGCLPTRPLTLTADILSRDRHEPLAFPFPLGRIGRGRGGSTCNTSSYSSTYVCTHLISPATCSGVTGLVPTALSNPSLGFPRRGIRPPSPPPSETSPSVCQSQDRPPARVCEHLHSHSFFSLGYDVLGREGGGGVEALSSRLEKGNVSRVLYHLSNRARRDERINAAGPCWRTRISRIYTPAGPRRAASGKSLKCGVPSSWS